jgi:hypothetical protein
MRAKKTTNTEKCHHHQHNQILLLIMMNLLLFSAAVIKSDDDLESWHPRPSKITGTGRKCANLWRARMIFDLSFLSENSEDEIEE